MLVETQDRATPLVKTRRGTSNTNARGSAEDRRRRREYLVTTYRANVDAMPRLDGTLRAVPQGRGIPACRCFRCGCLLTSGTVTVDRIVPGCQGGTYRRSNIRPACATCNESTGGALGAARVGRTA